jgi:hypothetical protein
MSQLRYRDVDELHEEHDRYELARLYHRYRDALERIASGATGYLDRDSELAEWAREALDDGVACGTGSLTPPSGSQAR